MKKFRYSMENILQIKIKLEDQAKISYGNARQKLTIEEEKQKQLELTLTSYEEELRALRTSKLDLHKIKLCEQAIDIMKYKIKQQIVHVRNAKQRLEVARIRLDHAMAEHKIQEKLKEKAWEDYILEFEAEEQKEINERNSFHYSSPTFREEDV